jgi:endoglucanase
VKKLVFAILLLGLCSCASLQSPTDRSTVPLERLAYVSRSIGIDDWFARGQGTQGTLGPDDFKFLKSAGFTACRLRAAPYLDAPNMIDEEFLQRLDSAITMILDSGLAVILDLFHYNSYNHRFEKSLAHDKPYEALVEKAWERVAQRYALFSTDRIFFETLNEPSLSDVEPFNFGWWALVQEQLIAAIRRGAPLNTIIATGERWGSIAGLLDLKPSTDHNVIYSFHFYEPWAFALQGCSWVPGADSIHHLTYPYLRDGEDWNYSRILSRLQHAARWSKANGVPILCGEFGVSLAAPQESRYRYLMDMRVALETLGIGWNLWAYDGPFAVTTRWIALDQPVLAYDERLPVSLGFSPKAALMSKLNDSPALSLFLSEKSRELRMQPPDWEGLWTKEQQGCSLETARNDSGEVDRIYVVNSGCRRWVVPTGVRIRVKAGERFAISALCLLQGSGTASLEIVAHAARDFVLWTKDVSSPISGDESGQMRFEYAPAPGVTWMELQWTGTGPATIRLETIKIERMTAEPG